MSKWNIAARRRARRFALQALYQWEFNPVPYEDIIEQFLKEPEMKSVDTEFFQQLVKETIKQCQKLDNGMHLLLKHSAFVKYKPLTLGAKP